jgi:hypothetical protein
MERQTWMDRIVVNPKLHGGEVYQGNAHSGQRHCGQSCGW